MNNHLSPKAPKPLLWPQTPFLASPPLLRSPRRSFGCPAAPSVALPLLRLPRLSLGCPAAPSVGEPIFLHSHSSLATPLVAYSGARSARKASSRAPNRQICSRDPHPAPSRAPNRQICSRDPHLASSRAPNRPICSRHFRHSFKSCRKSSSQEYATGGSMVFFGTGRSIDPSPPAILAIFSIRSAGSSGLKKATLPHPADVS